jgi:uridine kinase
MAIWAPALKDTLLALSDEILGLYGSGRNIVAIDGRSGAGTAAFSDALAETMRLGTEKRPGGHKVFRASIGNFRKPTGNREGQGADTAAAFYGDAFDYSVFRRILVDPFRASGSTSFVLAAYDEPRGVPIQPKWMSAGKDAILIVDGVFLNRPELAGLWNYSVWLDADPVGEDFATAADAVYVAEAGPRTAAVAIIDNRDPEHPRRVFADSC